MADEEAAVNDNKQYDPKRKQGLLAAFTAFKLKPSFGAAKLRTTLAALGLCLAAVILVAAITTARRHLRHNEGEARVSQVRDNLVMYIFSNSDPEYLTNLKFFITEAVMQDDRSEFVFIVQEEEAKALDLPKLPPYARYIQHSNECFDWGTYGWVLTSGVVDVAQYKYFFLINCSVRGPFIPPMLKGMFPWWYPMVSLIKGDVKLAGSTISCEAAPQDEDMQGSWRTNPHVQSFALVTDKVGLDVMLNDGQVFKCHESLWKTVYHSELGSAAAVLGAGYNLDSLMLRYQEVDWRDARTWDCNAKFSPNGEYSYDGLTLDPYEVLFVKVRSFLLDQQVVSAEKALKYDFWAHRANITERVVLNDYVRHANAHKVPKILEKIAHGQDCFDSAYYLKKNPDLAAFETDTDLWKHFVYFGQFEPRQHRYRCPMDYKKFAGFLTAGGRQ